MTKSGLMVLERLPPKIFVSREAQLQDALERIRDEAKTIREAREIIAAVFTT